MPRTPPARPQWWPMSPRTSSVRPPTRSRRRVPRRPDARSAPAGSSAGGSGNSSRTRSASSSSTISGCATTSAGRCSTADPGPRHGPSRRGEDLDVPVGSVHTDLLPVRDGLRGVLHPDDGRQVVPSILSAEGLAVRCEHPGWRERLMGPELGLASTDELVVDMLRAHDVAELLERQEVDVLLLAQHVVLRQAVGLVQEGLLVEEVATDHPVLRMFAVPGEGPDTIDHLLGLLGIALPVRQGSHACEHLLFLPLRLL